MLVAEGALPMSASFMIDTGSVSIPAICVACGAPAAPYWSDGQGRASLPVSGSSRFGNRVVTARMSFPLCPDCAAARARSLASRYPVSWMVRSLFLASAIALVAFIAGVQVEKAGGPAIAGWFFAASVVSLVAALWLKVRTQREYDRANPPDEDDVRRLALMKGAVYIHPMLDTGPIRGASIAFTNDTFARAFGIANPGGLAGFAANN